MDVKHRLTRTVGTAAVALFLVSSVAFGADGPDDHGGVKGPADSTDGPGDSGHDGAGED